MKFFEEFFNVTGKNLPDVSELTPEEKAALAQQLKNKGESVRNIATFFDLSVPRIYQLLSEAKKLRLNELECQTYKDHFLEVIYELECDIEMYKKVQSTLRDKYKAQEVGKDGELHEVEKQGSIRDYKDVGSLIFSLQKELIRLKSYVGIIPGQDVADIYQSLNDLSPENKKKTVAIREQNSDQVKATLLEKLGQKKPTIKDNAMKMLADQSIL